MEGNFKVFCRVTVPREEGRHTAKWDDVTAMSFSPTSPDGNDVVVFVRRKEDGRLEVCLDEESKHPDDWDVVGEDFRVYID